jgi:hypothetical protein
MNATKGLDIGHAEVKLPHRAKLLHQEIAAGRMP